MTAAQTMYDYLVEWEIPADDNTGMLETLNYATSLYGMTEQVIEDWCYYHFAVDYAESEKA